MKVIKRLARNMVTGALESPLRATGNYMLVELRESAAGNTASSSATADLVSDMETRIAEMSRKMTTMGDKKRPSATQSSAQSPISVVSESPSKRIKLALRRKQLTGGTTYVSSDFHS